MSSRTKNSAKNAIYGFITKLILIFVSFIARTIFIHYLSVEYLGINGLFTNILTILSFAELGIGNAIIFKLYKPISENDYAKINSLINFYKRIYTLIGIFVLTIGLVLTPFLNSFISEMPDIKESIHLIYILFVINSSLSYFFAHKKSIIFGYQKNYITTSISFVVTLFLNIFQILAIIITKNFILYVVLQIIATLVDNIIASIKASKMYKEIKYNKNNKLSKTERKEIYDDVKSLAIYKFGYALANGTDNIIISKFINIISVGLLSNYNIIISAITSVLGTAFTGLTASIGNLNATDKTKNKEKVFYQVLLMSFIIYSFVSVATIVLFNKFIIIWLGSDYTLSFAVAFALGFNLYIDGMRYPNYTFRNTLGLFKAGRFLPLISSCLNVILSLILVKPLGVFGVLIATGISRLVVLMWYDPYLLHKHAFKTSPKRFYLTYAYYFIITGIMLAINIYIINKINLNGFTGFIISGIIIGVICLIIILISTKFLKETEGLKEKIFKLRKRSV